MNKETLQQKKLHYTNLCDEIISKDYSGEIEIKVAEYRKKLVTEVETSRQKDLDKIEHYLELLDELIEEIDSTTENVQTTENYY